MENITIMTYDSSGNVLACLHSDTSGNFTGCTDLSNNYLPCLPTPATPAKQVSKTHISDTSRCFPYDSYPYYGYPYYGYPYGGYPYLFSDDYYNRSIDANMVHQPTHPISKPPNSGMNHLVMRPPIKYGSPGTQIHIHN